MNPHLSTQFHSFHMNPSLYHPCMLTILVRMILTNRSDIRYTEKKRPNCKNACSIYWRMIFYYLVALLSWNDNFIITYLRNKFLAQSYSFICHETLVISHRNNCAKRSNFQGWMTNITRRVSNLFWLITYWIGDEINVWLVKCYFFKWKRMQKLSSILQCFSRKG